MPLPPSQSELLRDLVQASAAGAWDREQSDVIKSFNAMMSAELQQHQSMFVSLLQEQVHQLLRQHRDSLLGEVGAKLQEAVPEAKPFEMQTMQLNESFDARKSANIVDLDTLEAKVQEVVPESKLFTVQSSQLTRSLDVRQCPNTADINTLGAKFQEFNSPDSKPPVSRNSRRISEKAKMSAQPSMVERTTPASMTKSMETSQEFGPRCVPVQRIVGTSSFEFASTGVIMMNTLFMVAEAQYQGEVRGYNIRHPEFTNLPADFWSDFFLAVSCVFNAIFLLELIMRLMCAQLKALSSPWLWLDTILVGLGVCETLSALQIVDFMQINVNVLRVVRLARVLRLIKVMKKKTAVHSLFLLAKSIQAAVSSSVWSFVLLLLIMIVTGLIFNQAVSDPIENTPMTHLERIELFNLFGTMSKTIVTMFELTTANWPTVCRQMMVRVGDGWGYLIVFYRCVFCFAVVNVICAVFISETARVAAADDEVAIMNKDRAARHMTSKLKAIFDTLDESGDGCVTWDEFSSLLHDEVMIKFMNALDLDVNDAHHVFTMLGEAEGITYDEFVDGMRSIHGNAKRIDVATLKKQVTLLDHKLTHILDGGHAASMFGYRH